MAYSIFEKTMVDMTWQEVEKALIALPYYWGINYCTGGFPGSFSLRPETMKAVLMD